MGEPAVMLGDSDVGLFGFAAINRGGWIQLQFALLDEPAFTPRRVGGG
jgi:hypothetical protein